MYKSCVINFPFINTSDIKVFIEVNILAMLIYACLEKSNIGVKLFGLKSV